MTIAVVRQHSEKGRARRGRLTRKLMDIAVCLVAVVIIASMRSAGCTAATAGPSRAAASSTDPLSREAERRHDELIKQGFNLTRSARLAPADLVRFELVIPPGGEQAISVWLAAERGEMSLDWRDPTGQIVTAWTGRLASSTSSAPSCQAGTRSSCVPPAAVRTP